MHSVISAKRVITGTLDCLGEKRFADAVDVNSTPEALQFVDAPTKLGGGQTAALSHAGQSGCRLDVRDRRGPYPISTGVGLLGLLGPWLVDQQLYQGAGIEVEAQRRPSET
jgi:hypothetical protein